MDSPEIVYNEFVNNATHQSPDAGFYKLDNYRTPKLTSQMIAIFIGKHLKSEEPDG